MGKVCRHGNLIFGRCEKCAEERAAMSETIKAKAPAQGVEAPRKEVVNEAIKKAVQAAGGIPGEDLTKDAPAPLPPHMLAFHDVPCWQQRDDLARDVLDLVAEKDTLRAKVESLEAALKAETEKVGKLDGICRFSEKTTTDLLEHAKGLEAKLRALKGAAREVAGYLYHSQVEGKTIMCDHCWNEPSQPTHDEGCPIAAFEAALGASPTKGEEAPCSSCGVVGTGEELADAGYHKPGCSKAPAPTPAAFEALVTHLESEITSGRVTEIELTGELMDLIAEARRCLVLPSRATAPGVLEALLELAEAVGDVLQSPYLLDQATIPLYGGIAAAPKQVVGNMCVGLLKYRRMESAYKAGRAALQATPQEAKGEAGAAPRAGGAV